MRRAGLALVVAAASVAGALTLAIGSDGDESPAPAPTRGAATDEWRALTPATLARTEVAAARIGRFIYVVGGFEEKSGVTTGALERYDIRRNRWKRLRPMPGGGVNHPAAVAYRGRFYVHGGYTGRRDLSSATPALWRYNPARNRWRRLPDAPTPRAAHALAAIDGRLYAAAGANESGSLASLEIYHVKRRRWTGGPKLLGRPRNHTTGVAAGGFFYVLAGRENGNYTDSERYDPDARRWQDIPDMEKARGGIASVRVGRRIVVFGGEEATTIREVEIYDPRTRRWARLPDMRTPRHGLGGAALGKRIYAIEGGPIPGFHFSNAIEYLDLP